MIATVVDVVTLHGGSGILLVLEREGPVRMQGVIRHILRVDLLPNVNLSGFGPSCTTILWHHPEGWEVATVRFSEDTRFGSTILEREFPFALDAPRDEVFGFLTLETLRSGYGAANEFSVAEINHSRVI